MKEDLLRINYDGCRTTLVLSAKNKQILQSHNINISKLTRQLTNQYIHDRGLK